MEIQCNNIDLLEQFNQRVNGKINASKIHDHLMLFEMEFYESKKMNLRLSDKDIYCYYLYNLKGNMSIALDDSDSEKITAFQSAIIYNSNMGEFWIEFNSQEIHHFCLIQLKKYNNETNDALSVERILEMHGFETNLIYVGSPNLNICDWVRKLLHLSKEKSTNNLMISGYIDVILGMKLKEFLECDSQPKNTINLSSWEIKQINSLTDQIYECPENQFTIESLCSDSGLSVMKLQEGFKRMHGKTVSNYIRDIRFIKAEELIKTTDLNISQIVYSIGLSSRSYFCRIFKQKYKCTPKKYKQQFSLAETA